MYLLPRGSILVTKIPTGTLYEEVTSSTPCASLSDNLLFPQSRRALCRGRGQTGAVLGEVRGRARTPVQGPEEEQKDPEQETKKNPQS